MNKYLRSRNVKFEINYLNSLLLEVPPSYLPPPPLILFDKTRISKYGEEQQFILFLLLALTHVSLAVMIIPFTEEQK